MPDRFKESLKVAEFKIDLLRELSRLILLEEGFDSFVIVFGHINILEDLLIAAYEGLIIHFGNEVQ